MSGDGTFDCPLTQELTHCYHDYPARMISQVAGRLLDLCAKNARLLFNPYCGSRTSLVEGYGRAIDTRHEAGKHSRYAEQVGPIPRPLFRNQKGGEQDSVAIIPQYRHDHPGESDQDHCCRAA